MRRPYYDLVATGENLRALRRKHNLKADDVRVFMELESVQSIYKWEQGKCFPTADNLLALAHLYEVSPEQLLVKSGFSGGY